MAAYCGVVSIAHAKPSRTDIAEDISLDPPRITLVWNDPVNLMSYLTYVFQTYFGYSREKAYKLMLGVHQNSRAVASNGPRETMERDTKALLGYELWVVPAHAGMLLG